MLCSKYEESQGFHGRNTVLYWIFHEYVHGSRSRATPGRTFNLDGRGQTRGAEEQEIERENIFIGARWLVRDSWGEENCIFYFDFDFFFLS